MAAVVGSVGWMVAAVGSAGRGNEGARMVSVRGSRRMMGAMGIHGLSDVCGGVCQLQIGGCGGIRAPETQMGGVNPPSFILVDV